MKRVIATLGPVGTDAEAMAKELTNEVVLCPSFPDAMSYAKTHSVQALVACGYKRIVGNQIVDTWVDLHFKYHNILHIVNTYCKETKTMCLAKRIDCAMPQKLVIHPATQTFAQLAPWEGVEIFYVDAKPTAALLTSEGRYDACIASQDTVTQYPELEIVQIIKPEMVWALYEG